ncbi:MAG: hypothetical protein M1838_003623 [Thelocarpon superellum]|nr:MAG: hypothetical protein M1838_003623 [Thelocarpon superellum]
MPGKVRQPAVKGLIACVVLFLIYNATGTARSVPNNGAGFSSPSTSSSSDGSWSVAKLSAHVPSLDRWRAAFMTSAGSSSASKPNEVLIQYAYAESETGRRNLQFFLKHGLHDAADFIFILNGETNMTSKIPTDRDNVEVVQRANSCMDVGAHGEVLGRDSAMATSKYKRFILMNASIRGPFLPSYSRACWSDVYTDMITDRVKIAGMTMNCAVQEHVQSMVIATDQTGLKIMNETCLKTCFTDKSEAIYKCETELTAAVREAGYEADALMTAYRGWGRGKFKSECEKREEPDANWNGNYFGSNMHAYEAIFVKANRDIDPTGLEHLTEWHDRMGYSSYEVCKRR